MGAPKARDREDAAGIDPGATIIDPAAADLAYQDLMTAWGLVARIVVGGERWTV
jgi:hypothetical protein